MAWHQVPIYCSDCNYCVTRDAAVSQGNGTPPRRVDVLMQWVKCMSRPACKCGPATRSCCSSCMLKHFHVMSKIREVCRMDSAVLWHCAKSRFQLPYLLSYRKSTIGVSGWLFNPFHPKLILVHTTVTGTCRRAYKTCKNWPLCSYVGWHQHSQPNAEKSAQCAKMTTGANGKKACILRTDEMHDAIWHHGAGKG